MSQTVEVNLDRRHSAQPGMFDMHSWDLVIDNLSSGYGQLQTQRFDQSTVNILYDPIVSRSPCVKLPDELYELSLTCKEIRQAIRRRQLVHMSVQTRDQMCLLPDMISVSERQYIQSLLFSWERGPGSGNWDTPRNPSFSRKGAVYSGLQEQWLFVKTLPNLTSLTVTHLDDTDWEIFAPASDSVRSLRILHCLAVPEGRNVDLNDYFSGLTSLVVAEGHLKLRGILTCRSLQSLTLEMSVMMRCARILLGLSGATDKAGEGYPWALSETIMTSAKKELREAKLLNSVCECMKFGPGLDKLNLEIEPHFLFQEEDNLSYLAFWLRRLRVPIRSIQITINTCRGSMALRVSTLNYEYLLKKAPPADSSEWLGRLLPGAVDVHFFARAVMKQMPGLHSMDFKIDAQLRGPPVHTVNAMTWRFIRQDVDREGLPNPWIDYTEDESIKLLICASLQGTWERRPRPPCSWQIPSG